MRGTGTREQPVVEALAAAHAVAAAVVCHGGHYDEVYVGHVGGVLAVGFLYAEGAKVRACALVGQYVEVETVDARQVERLASFPAVDKLAGGKLVGQRVYMSTRSATVNEASEVRLSNTRRAASVRS